MGNFTFTIIKPTAVMKGYAGEIMSMIYKSGFRVKAMKMLRLSKIEAMDFYSVHKERPFYDELTDFMSSGPIFAAIIEKENAVSEYRKFIGATNPKEAKKGTVRNMYASDIQANAVHGSDSDENAIIESNFFFSTKERF